MSCPVNPGVPNAGTVGSAAGVSEEPNALLERLVVEARLWDALPPDHRAGERSAGARSKAPEGTT
jgi:hypothetical protein